MFSAFYNLVFYKPLYNGLVFLVDKIPFHDLGFAIIALTLIVRVILFPLGHKSSMTQRKIKEVNPEIEKIKDKLKDKKEEQAKEIMALYKRHGINPFSSFLMALVQIPVLITIFIILRKGASFDESILYSFVNLPPPSLINNYFLGYFDMLKPSYVFSILAGVSQFFQIKLAMPSLGGSKKGGKSFKDELQKSLNIQMKYIMPVLIAFISLSFSAALPLYWTTSNVFAILHEIIVKKKAEEIK